jgi:hypothetical protein
MVQNSRAWLIVWKIFLRIVVLILVAFIANFESPLALEILKNNLGYITPEGFFGFNLTDDFVSFELALVFVSGVFLGLLGKVADYILIIFFILFAAYDYFSVTSLTNLMTFGFVGAVLLGNAIGFGLKLLRQKFLPKLKV